MNTPIEFGEIDNSTLAALLFEIASQLHEERSSRLALQTALITHGRLTEQDIASIAENSQFREQARESANQAVCRLLRTLTESRDERAPLRRDKAIR